MYIIWWKFRDEEPDTLHFAECETLEAAQKTWDAIDALPDAWMMCQRP